MENYNMNYDNKKIPYDDIPINRNYSSSGGGRKTSSSGFSLWRVILCLVIIVNVALSCSCIYLIKRVQPRTINQITLELNSDTTSEVSSVIATSTYLSSVCVAAGGSCSNESNFYNGTLSRGSGVVYRVDEENKTIYFTTCYHVISGYEDKVWVLLPTALKPIQVSVVGYSAHYDIAVLKYRTTDIEGTLNGSKPVTLGESSILSLGEKVFAIGNSLSGGLSITEGVVSRINTLVKISGNSFATREIQTSAEINPGNSGGGLYNLNGKFIGLVNAKRSTANSGNESITVEGTAYAIPGALVVGLADSMIRNNGKPSYVNLGVSFANDIASGKQITYVSYAKDVNGEIITANNEGVGPQKQVEKYVVKVDAVTAGSVSHRKLMPGDIISAVEFDYDKNGTQNHLKIDMFNIYTLEDYLFSIKKDSTVKFYIEGKEEPISIIARDISIVGD